MDSTNSTMSSFPNGLALPITVDASTGNSVLWEGETELEFAGKSESGAAKVTLELIPQPELRFSFVPQVEKNLYDQLLHCPLGDAVIKAGKPLGDLKVRVARAADSYSGRVVANVLDSIGPTRMARFGIINGPILHGSPINIGTTTIAARQKLVTSELEILIDACTVDRPDRSSIFECTHVAQCSFSSPISMKEVVEVADDLFRTLSLMKLGWVGVLGPWLFDEHGESTEFRAAVTKTTKIRRPISWYHETMQDTLSQLFPLISRAFRDKDRMEAIKTAFHWLIESELCAGGVEGSLILQQAALECLAWQEIVQSRRICSESGFKSLPASDKIRWLTSLYMIDPAIPARETDIVAYAKAFNLVDLVDVLVDVRNALVHAEPKKLTKLFSRANANMERIGIWFQAGGLLQQAFLAIIGYSGYVLRRDLDADFSLNAIKLAPWAK